MYMHVLGHGDPVKIATALHTALALSKTPLEFAAPAPGRRRRSISILPGSTARSAPRAATAGGIYQFGIPRAEPVKEADMVVPASHGFGEAINFQPTGGGKAAITGDFVLTASEVDPVMKALRQSGIEVTAVHNHMVDEQPRLYFMHFWAHDDALKLAAGLKAALAHINVAHG